VVASVSVYNEPSCARDNPGETPLPEARLPGSAKAQRGEPPRAKSSSSSPRLSPRKESPGDNLSPVVHSYSVPASSFNGIDLSRAT